jgi:hypothetical protein
MGARTVASSASVIRMRGLDPRSLFVTSIRVRVDIW